MERWCIAAASIAAFGFIHESVAEEYHNTNLQVLYTTQSKPDPLNGTGTSNERLTSARLEHYSTYRLGDNYFFADNYHGDDVGEPGVKNQQYMAYMPRLSLAKALRHDMTYGIVKDMYLGGRVEYASYGHFNATAFGPSFDLKLLGLDWAQLRLFWQRTNFDSLRFYTHFAWGKAFPVANRKLHFEGYFWTRPKDQGGRQWFGETHLALDVDPKGVFQLGARLTVAKNLGYSRTTPQLLVKWNF